VLRRKRTWAKGDTEAGPRMGGGIYVCFLLYLLHFGGSVSISPPFIGEEFGSRQRAEIQQSIDDTEIRVIRGLQPALQTTPKAPSQVLGRCCEVCQLSPIG